ncbi:hypothetical protein AB0H83_48425 [Dactylosporangium sp. NPDC050688]|uniref:hypothetical protein n=1 Tax=Dactylosporangium sp. NPDC050688 TaxID=3157217 RepID=UPI0033C3AF4B
MGPIVPVHPAAASLAAGDPRGRCRRMRGALPSRCGVKPSAQMSLSPAAAGLAS